MLEANAFSLPADAIVLKYAQALYGVDAKAVGAAGLEDTQLPGVGDHLFVRNPRGLQAGAMLLLGVAPLHGFGYREIRDFGRWALSCAAREVPDAVEIVMTLHGAGYGLDEFEAFDSELAGILDAIHDGDVPRRLARVRLAELDPGRAARMRARLAHLLHDATEVTRGAPIGQAVPGASADRLRSVGYDSARREHAFVAMPFAVEFFEDLFHYGISSAIRRAGLLCERIDQQAFTGDVLDRLKRQIRTARIVVADLSHSNPNVFLEVGYAWGCGVETVLLCRQDSDLKFDVQGQRCLRYGTIKQAEAMLTKELSELVGG